MIPHNLRENYKKYVRVSEFVETVDYLNVNFIPNSEQNKEWLPLEVLLWQNSRIACQVCLFVFLALHTIVVVFSESSSGLQFPCFRGFLITHNDAPQSVGLLWRSDQSVAETSTWQHTTLTTDKHPCPRWDSNSQSQLASGRRPMP